MKSVGVTCFVISLCCVVSMQVEARPSQEMEKTVLIETENIREETEVYGSQLNRSNNMWPQTGGGFVFSLPRQLKEGDEINVTSLFINNPRWMSLSLTEENGPNVPDYNNIAGSIGLDISQDKFLLKTVVNGTSQSIEPDNPVANTPSNILVENNTLVPVFSIKIRIAKNEDMNTTTMGFEISHSVVKDIELQHDISRIKYLTLQGDVEKVSNLHFQFA